MAKITVKDTDVTIIKINDDDYISITDMLKAKDGDFFVLASFDGFLRLANLFFGFDEARLVFGDITFQCFDRLIRLIDLR